MIRPATPELQPIICGITAPSGAGKTLSALMLAHGIRRVAGGEIGMIDTEGRRGLRYADKAKYPSFDFKHLDFQPPFSADRYGEAIKAMLEVPNMKTIIIDSMSHEHEGSGGYLEFHEAELDRVAGDDWRKRQKMTFTAWIKPAAARRRLINSFLQVPVNFIFCFRAKEKLKIIAGAEPIPLGWQAIAGEEFVYEMISRFLLPPGARGMPDWSDAAFAHGAAKRDDQDRALMPDNERISEAMGERIAKAYSGKAVAPRLQTEAGPNAQPSTGEGASQPDEFEELKEDGLAAAQGGVAVLTTWWARQTPNTKRALEKFKDETLKPRAKHADEEAGVQA